jgi:hypothetical protein
MSGWTEEATERLRGLAALGWSAGMIAAEIGATRNAIIGRCRRLGVKLGIRQGVGGRRLPASKVVLDQLTAEERLRVEERLRWRRRAEAKTAPSKTPSRVYKPSRLLAPWINPVRNF